jgi:hypothetical protein
MTDSAAEPRKSSDFLTSDRVAGAALLGIAVFAVWQNSVLPLGTLSEPGPGSVPLMLAVLLGLTGALVFAFGAGSPLVRALGWSDFPRAAAILAAAGFAAFAFERLGYRVTIASLLIFLIGVVERQRPIAVLAISLGFAVISYWIFNSLLLVQLPRGPLGI